VWTLFNLELMVTASFSGGCNISWEIVNFDVFFWYMDLHLSRGLCVCLALFSTFTASVSQKCLDLHLCLSLYIFAQMLKFDWGIMIRTLHFGNRIFGGFICAWQFVSMTGVNCWIISDLHLTSVTKPWCMCCIHCWLLYYFCSTATVP